MEHDFLVGGVEPPSRISIRRIGNLALLFFIGILAIILCAWIAAPVEKRAKGPVILISIDGFRPEYLDRKNLTKNLNTISTMGIRATHMISQFPTKTFPNHYSIVTGLYPESHGIVSNSFYDPILNDSFNYQSDLSNKDGKWWGGEP